MTRVSLDDADVRILGFLQEDATLSVAAVAAKANMSQNACWRRIKRLEESRVISRRVTILDASALGLEDRSEEHTSELQSLMRISYAVFCLKKKKKNQKHTSCLA